MKTARNTAISILAIGLLAGSAVGVAAQAEEAEAIVSSFTGAVSGGEGLGLETVDEELPNGFMKVNGQTYRTKWTASDERLTGTLTGVNHWVIDPNGFEPWATGGQPNMITSSALQLDNDGGSWLGEGTSFSSTELDAMRETIIFVGQDGYQGLTAYVLLENEPAGPPTFIGVIVPAAMPEAPEPYTGG